MTDEREIAKADAFAAKAHEGQQRKYTGEPYINHPREVADILREVGGDTAMICAALLHDVVEGAGHQFQRHAHRDRDGLSGGRQEGAPGRRRQRRHDGAPQPRGRTSKEGQGMTYNLDDLRAAVEQTRRGPLLLSGNPHQDKADAIRYSQSLDNVRQSLLIAARSGLLDDAALGRAVRAAAERDGPERQRAALAILNSDRVAAGLRPMESRDDVPDSHGYVRNAQAAARALVDMKGSADV